MTNIQPATVSVTKAAKMLGISATAAYAAIRTGSFPTPVIKVGTRRYLIPTTALCDLLGVDALPATS